jgi:hypothetical protein
MASCASAPGKVGGGTNGRCSNTALLYSRFVRCRLRLCQRRLAFCLSVLGFVRPPIGEALAAGALEEQRSTFRVLDA